MTSLSDLIAQSAASAWLFMPSAVLLGALHGLEPGHSKTMMAAFVVATRGTVMQAALLALAATVSHTAVIWALAILVLAYGSQWSVEATEPYFQLASGFIVIGLAIWMLMRTRRDLGVSGRPHRNDHQHDRRLPQGHGHPHDHDHDRGHAHPHAHAHASTERDEAVHLDPHARAHAEQIRRRFADRPVATGQVALFGLTGGLLPCSAAVTVLILCLQLQRFWLGIVLVLCFSIGLAITLLASGVIAALGVRHATKRLGTRFTRYARYAPYVSGAIVVGIGLFLGYMGLAQLLSPGDA